MWTDMAAEKLSTNYGFIIYTQVKMTKLLVKLSTSVVRAIRFSSSSPLGRCPRESCCCASPDEANPRCRSVGTAKCSTCLRSRAGLAYIVGVAGTPRLRWRYLGGSVAAARAPKWINQAPHRLMIWTGTYSYSQLGSRSINGISQLQMPTTRCALTLPPCRRPQ